MAREYKILNGSSLVLPARPSFNPTLIDWQQGDREYAEVPDTDLGSEVDRAVAGKVLKVGDYTATIRNVPGLAIPDGQEEETFRIVFPLLSGQTTPGKIEFNGWIKKVTGLGAKSDERTTVSFTVRVNTKPAWTEGT